MKTATIRVMAGVLAVAVCAALADPVHAAVGARVLAQQWNPREPDKQDVKVLVDRPSSVSDTLMSAWSQVRGQICNDLVKAMSRPRAAAGQTLRDIDCRLDDSPALDVKSTRPDSIAATFTIHGNSLTATSTQPTVCGRECDPRFSLTLNATFELGLAVLSDPNRPLAVSRATFTMANASLDSHNFSGDVLKFVVDDLVPFFGGPNYKRLAEDAINSASMSLLPTFNSALSPVNALMKAPNGYVRVGVWGRPGRITIAFAPREIVPPINGAMSGVVRWNPGEFTPRNGCAGFDLAASVQTGPAPLLNPDDYSVLGPAPQRQIGRFSASAAGDGRCSYSLSGLAPEWPNYVTARPKGGSGDKRGGLVALRYALEPDGWKGPIVPKPSAAGRNYVVARGYGGVDAEVNPLHKVAQPGDPVIDQRSRMERRAVTPAQVKASAVQATDSIKNKWARRATTTAVRSQPGAAQSLNPQPLPPSPGAAQSLNPQPLPPSPGAAQSLNPQPLPPAARRTSSLNQRGIIIVGGKAAGQMQSAAPAAPKQQ